MPNRVTLAKHGRRGQIVHCFTETVRGRKLVRVQWTEYSGAPRSTESWPATAANIKTAKAYAEGVAARLAAGGAAPIADRSIRELADAHVLAMSESWAPATLRNFRHRWGRFEAFVPRHTPAKLITEETLDEFRAKMRKEGVATNQRTETIKVVKQVFRWARRRKLIAENPIADYVIKLAKGETRKDVPEWSPDDVRRLLEQLAREGATRSSRHWRLEVALHLAALQGPRQTALRHIHVDDINLSGETRRHPTAPGVVLPPRSIWWNPAYDKRGEERVQPLTRGAVRAIRIARVWRARIGATTGWLLPPVHDKQQPWTYQALNQALRNLCDRCTPPVDWIDGRALHGFRKYSAGEVHRLTGSERDSADWIGDKDVKVVRRHYLKKRAEEQRSVAQRVVGPTTPRRATDPAERAARAGRRAAGSRPRMPGDFQHGTLSGYNYRRCRCDECLTAYREWQREHRGVTPERQRTTRNHSATTSTVVAETTNAPRAGGASEVEQPHTLTEGPQ